MYCYKCTTDKELSPKVYRKDGSILYICRTCRRNEQYPRLTPPRKPSQVKAEQEWRQFAREKNSALAKKYASTNRST